MKKMATLLFVAGVLTSYAQRLTEVVAYVKPQACTANQISHNNKTYSYNTSSVDIYDDSKVSTVGTNDSLKFTNIFVFRDTVMFLAYSIKNPYNGYLLKVKESALVAVPNPTSGVAICATTPPLNMGDSLALCYFTPGIKNYGAAVYKNGKIVRNTTLPTAQNIASFEGYDDTYYYVLNQDNSRFALSESSSLQVTYASPAGQIGNTFVVLDASSKLNTMKNASLAKISDDVVTSPVTAADGSLCYITGTEMKKYNGNTLASVCTVPAGFNASKELVNADTTYWVDLSTKSVLVISPLGTSQVSFGTKSKYSPLTAFVFQKELYIAYNDDNNESTVYKYKNGAFVTAFSRKSMGIGNLYMLNDILYVDDSLILYVMTDNSGYLAGSALGVYDGSVHRMLFNLNQSVGDYTKHNYFLFNNGLYYASPYAGKIYKYDDSTPSLTLDPGSITVPVPEIAQNYSFDFTINTTGAWQIYTRETETQMNPFRDWSIYPVSTSGTGTATVKVSYSAYNLSGQDISTALFVALTDGTATQMLPIKIPAKQSGTVDPDPATSSPSIASGGAPCGAVTGSTVQILTSARNVAIYSNSGILAAQYQDIAAGGQLDISDLPAGSYILVTDQCAVPFAK